MEIRNAKIFDVSLTMKDHGMLTFDLNLIGGGWGVHYGGYCLGKGYLGATTFLGTDAGLEAIMRVMDVVGVDRWEDLKGKYIRAEVGPCGSRVTKIGNIVKDNWFDIKKFFELRSQKDV